MSFRTTLACLLLASCLLGQGVERLTLEALAHPTQKKTYVGMPTTRLEWLPDGALLQTRRDGDQTTLLRVDATTWASSPPLESSRLLAALLAARAPEAEAKTALGRGAYLWNEQHTAFLLEVVDQLFCLDVKAASARRLAGGRPEEPAFSPDGTQVAYLRG
ncbi:MAG TPA: hypothetical protein VF378_12100, partial [Geothrix sp.]